MKFYNPLVYIIGIFGFFVVVVTIYIFQQLKSKKTPITNQPIVQTQNLYYDLCDICNQVIMSNVGFPTYDFFINNRLQQGIYFYNTLEVTPQGCRKLVSSQILLFEFGKPIGILTPEEFHQLQSTPPTNPFVKDNILYTIHSILTPITQRYPKNSNLAFEKLPYKSKTIIRKNESEIFKAVTKASFQNKKYLFLQVRLLDIVDISNTLYKDSIRSAWVNYLASKTVDYVFYDIQNREVYGALLCTKNSSKTDEETLSILSTCGIKTVMMNEKDIYNLMPTILKNFASINPILRNNYTFNKDKIYPKDFDFENDILPLYKKDIFTDNEFRFFQKIARYAFDNKQYLTIKLRLVSFMQTDNITIPPVRTAWHNIINKKHTDFLLYDVDSRKPTACIEIDDSTHLMQETIIRDNIKDNILKSAGIPIIRLNNPNDIFENKKLKNVLKKR